MTPVDANLAELIGSRICHDLISPIGAINNGLELLAMSGASDGPELGLIGESVGNASARIRFFRIAFGAAGDQMIGPVEISSILRDLYGGSRLTMNWDLESPQPRAAVRLAFLAILCLETAMPYGGNIDVSVEDGDWQIKGTADRLNVDEGLWSMMAGQKTDEKLQPSHVQFALLPIIAKDDGRRVHSALDETQVSIRF